MSDQAAIDQGAIVIPDDAWLVVIDPQQIFAAGDSPWGSPMFPGILAPVRHLADAFGEQVVVTRFVASSDPRGSWVPYYREWSFAQVPDTDPLYDVVPEVSGVVADARVVTEPTFGKWGSRLRAIVGEAPTLVLTGVSTDCCVISTALAAADSGATVIVPADACAGSTPENHEHALAVMRLFAPQIQVTDAQAVIAGRAGSLEGDAARSK